ncbi:MAG TPA: hypothetical protein VNW92_04670 [Polyangiaceae bacterium]|nr:hypothetical protein [Polyangiaceae bacterium]
MSESVTAEASPNGQPQNDSSPDVQRGTLEADENRFLPPERLHDLRRKWNEVQAGFVDEPRSSVQQANELVGQVVDELTAVFTNERSTLEGQWNRGEEVDTEALRIALQRYRAFFNRLLGNT